MIRTTVADSQVFCDFKKGLAFVGFDEVLPLAAFWNDEGECDPSEATRCSAGPDANGLYVQIDLTKPGVDQ